MRIKVSRMFAIAGIAVIGTIATTSAELKIGYINSEQIFRDYEGTKQAQEKFNKEVARWEQEATKMQKDIKDLQEQLEKQSLLLSEERKSEIQAQLQEKMIEYQKFLQEKFGQQGEALKKNEDLTRPIVEQINVILEDIAKAENYDFVFDARNGGLVWAKPAYDLTERVLQILNKEK